jgi:hypothetical protein
MRYVTATIGAIFIFLGVVLISFVSHFFLPPALQQTMTIPVIPGLFRIWGPPAVRIGVVAGIVAAALSFRSTLKRHAIALAQSRAKVNAVAGGDFTRQP